MTAEVVAGTLLAYLRSSGALRASALVEVGAVDVDADGSAAVERPGSPIAEPLDPLGAEPVELGLEVRAFPPFRVDEEAGEVSAPLGALEHVAEGVRALARAFGGRSVALVEFPTDDGTPFALSAREGEGLVVVIGGDSYAMNEAWPTA